VNHRIRVCFLGVRMNGAFLSISYSRWGVGVRYLRGPFRDQIPGKKHNKAKKKRKGGRRKERGVFLSFRRTTPQHVTSR